MSDSDMLRELKKISKILLLSNAPAVEKELAKVATSTDRKRMWVLIDGNRMQKDIADAIRVTQAAVSYFLTAAQAADLIEYKRGEPPRRLLDYVPPAWVELISLEEGEKANVSESVKPQATLDPAHTTEEPKSGGSEQNG